MAIRKKTRLETKRIAAVKSVFCRGLNAGRGPVFGGEAFEAVASPVCRFFFNHSFWPITSKRGHCSTAIMVKPFLAKLTDVSVVTSKLSMKSTRTLTWESIYPRSGVGCDGARTQFSEPGVAFPGSERIGQTGISACRQTDVRRFVIIVRKVRIHLGK